ncbi:MAG: ROK family protein [Phycisphaeraceae bacterium]|nr:ROK family protein [Phycisphaeraceae bacterium]
MPKERPIVGVDLGGTNMQIGVVDASDSIIGASRKRTQADQGMHKVLDRLINGIEEACEQAGVEIGDLAGVGIGAPSPVDPESGVVLNAVNLGWKDVPLADILKDRLKTTIVVDNDVNVAVYGEWKLGAGKGASDMLGVWIGTGVGGGLVLNNRLYSGGFLTAGEIGHTTLFPGAPFGARNLENFCSRTNIAKRLEMLIRSNNASALSELTDGKLDKIKSKLIARAYAEGDDLTRLVVEDAADLIGLAAANAVTLLSLPRVILGGGFTEALGEPFVKKVRHATRQYAFPDRCKQVDVVASTLEDNAGLLGAALLARERMEGDGKD